jgi:hypothetical protein
MNDMTQDCLNTPIIILDDNERQRCEVWTRVMGYHRPVASFNIGKKGEYHERCFFEEQRAGLEGAIVVGSSIS